MSNKSFAQISLIFLATGCVSASKYDKALADAQTLRRERAVSVATLRQKEAQIDQLNGSLARQNERSSALEEKARRAARSHEACATSLDELTAREQKLRSELARQGKSLDELVSTKGALSSSLAQTRARLEELRKAQAAAEARAAVFRALALKLRHMVDAGELEIALRSGRMVLVLPTDVLFEPGKAGVGGRGKEALTQIASALSTIKDRRFQVSGHTDNDPIRYSGFDSNWELSTARALQVVKVLTEHGLSSSSLSAAGYAEFDPVAPNDSPEHKARNRRIEITLQPNIDELVAVPQDR